MLTAGQQLQKEHKGIKDIAGMHASRIMAERVGKKQASLLDPTYKMYHLPLSAVPSPLEGQLFFEEIRMR